MRATATTVGLAAAMLTSTACAPALLWYGHDPARLVRWELRSENGVAWLESRPVAEGARAARATSRRTDAFDEIVVAELVFGAGHTGGRFAVPARRGDRWYVLSDRGSGPGWDGVASLRFSPDGGQLVYLGQQASRWHVMRDGEWRSPAYDAIVDGTLTWSRGGRRVGYAAEVGGCVRVLAEQAPTRGCYRDVRGLVVGEEPAEDAFVVVPENDGASAERGGRMRLLRGGATLAEADEIVGLALTPAGKLGYAVRDGATWHFVLDGRREGPYPWLRSATFSRSGRRHGYVAGLPDGRSGVIIDGALRGAWAAAAEVVFSPDDRRVAYTVRAERGQTGIACDERIFPFDVVVETSVAFSNDSHHWGAVIGDLGRRRLSVVVDGQHRLPFDSEELFGAAAERAGDAIALRDWVSAALESDLRGDRR